MSTPQAEEQHHVHHLTPRRKANNNAATPSSLYSAAAMGGGTINKISGGAITPSPPSATTAAKNSRLDGSDSESDSDSSSSSSSSSHNTNKIDRRGLTSELASAGIDTSGLSDYELLRLRNIKRNEAKLRSLGLFQGITSKLRGGGADGGKYKSERVKKAAETRRRNKMLARERVERHNKEQEELRRKKYGGDNAVAAASDDNGGSGRVQPQRIAKAVTPTYSAKAIVPSKRRMQWESNLSSLQSFHKQFGTFQISATHHGMEYKSLQQWKSRQRKEYLLFKEGRKSALDKEQVTLLEQLGGDWLIGINRGRGRNVSRMSMKRRSTRQSRNLWTDYSDDDDYEEEEKVMAEWEEEDTESDDDEAAAGDDDEEVDVPSADSFSLVSEESEEEDKHQYAKTTMLSTFYLSESDKYPFGNEKKLSRQYDSESDELGTYSDVDSLQGLPQKHRHSIQRSRSSSTSRRRLNWADNNKFTERPMTSVTRSRRRREDSPPVMRSKRRLVSSLEVVAPAEIETNWSSPSLKRSRSYEDDYITPHRSSTRRLSTYSLREEESIVSAEDETSFQVGSARLRRKRYVHQRSSRRDEGYELIEKPMDEVVVKEIDLQVERDKLMAEYGLLYGRKCVILEKRDQLEKELRGMEFAKKILTDVGGS
ncbi:hypothetical protein ACHAXM_001801 [Skeletonema potamos]